MRGKAYLKTTWETQERPVASSKLNAWDDRIEAALELAFFFLSEAWGGGSGTLRGATEHDLRVVATTPPGWNVRVHAGYAFISRCPYKLGASVNTGDVTPPTTHPRIDLVQARLDAWDVSVVTGTESETPEAPEPGTNCIALARLVLRPGMTNIKDADDGVNGYIEDARSFL